MRFTLGITTRYIDRHPTASMTNNPLAGKVVRIPIQVLESYDFTTLQHHVDPNPTMNPNLVESMLSPDPNLRILYNIAKSRSWLWTLPILNDKLSHLLNYSIVYYVNLLSHFHLPHNPLFTSQSPND
jgi:hypothetical protein